MAKYFVLQPLEGNPYCIKKDKFLHYNRACGILLGQTTVAGSEVLASIITIPMQIPVSKFKITSLTVNRNVFLRYTLAGGATCDVDATNSLNKFGINEFLMFGFAESPVTAGAVVNPNDWFARNQAILPLCQANQLALFNSFNPKTEIKFQQQSGYLNIMLGGIVSTITAPGTDVTVYLTAIGGQIAVGGFTFDSQLILYNIFMTLEDIQ